MQHDIPIEILPQLLSDIGMTSPTDSNILKGYIEEDDDLKGFLEHITNLGFKLDNSTLDTVNSCKGVKFTIDFPDETTLPEENSKQCKSIW